MGSDPLLLWKKYWNRVPGRFSASAGPPLSDSVRPVTKPASLGVEERHRGHDILQGNAELSADLSAALAAGQQRSTRWRDQTTAMPEQTNRTHRADAGTGDTRPFALNAAR